jgi:hypothetical protein
MSKMPSELPADFEDAWPWMRTFRRIVRTAAEPRLDGEMVFSASDFSGSHKTSRYHVYGFVLADPAESVEGFARINHVRKTFLEGRRMSFKALNDAKRRQALVPFLQAAEELRGVCCVVAVTKRYQHMATSPSTLDRFATAGDLEGRWNNKAFETALRAVLLWSVLVSEVCRGQQYVTWVVDQDEIAANDLRHTDLLQLTGRVSQYFIRRMMSELCVCTTASEGTDIRFEDFAAIPDLAAGAFCETVNNWSATQSDEADVGGKYGLTDRSGKCDLINDWFFFPSTNLRRVAVLIDRDNGGGLAIKRITMRS